MAGLLLIITNAFYVFLFFGSIFFTYESIAKAPSEETLSHFHFYWHDTLTGQNPTAVQVASPVKDLSSSSTTRFGFVYVIDDPLTEGPTLKSKMVGRAQGFYVSASQEELGLLMTMNFAFMEGKYNGSTIAVLGRNVVFSKVREMPVIGGSGLFRFARGYVKAKTYSVNMTTGDAIVEYDAFVKHY